jgi:hypothetical protein
MGEERLATGKLPPGLLRGKPHAASPAQGGRSLCLCSSHAFAKRSPAESPRSARQSRRSGRASSEA